MLKRAVCVVLVWGLAGCAPAAQQVRVEVENQQNALVIDASAIVTAPLPVIWDTLTDYNGFARFVPGVLESHLSERRGAVAVVRQRGELRLLRYTYPIDVVLEFTERRPQVLESRLQSGNVHQLRGRYDIAPAKIAGRHTLRWRGVVEPINPLPPLIGAPVMRAYVNEQFRAVVREIERRARVLRAADKK